MEKIVRLYLQARNGNTFDEESFKLVSRSKGTGASGGLVAAFLSCFKKTQIISGMDFVTNVCHLEEQIAASSVVITGEGSLDQQTMEGKVVHKIHELGKKY